MPGDPLDDQLPEVVHFKSVALPAVHVNGAAPAGCVMAIEAEKAAKIRNRSDFILTGLFLVERLNGSERQPGCRIDERIWEHTHIQ